MRRPRAFRPLLPTSGLRRLCSPTTRTARHARRPALRRHRDPPRGAAGARRRPTRAARGPRVRSADGPLRTARAGGGQERAARPRVARPGGRGEQPAGAGEQPAQGAGAVRDRDDPRAGLPVHIAARHAGPGRAPFRCIDGRAWTGARCRRAAHQPSCGDSADRAGRRSRRGGRADAPVPGRDDRRRRRHRQDAAGAGARGGRSARGPRRPLVGRARADQRRRAGACRHRRRDGAAASGQPPRARRVRRSGRQAAAAAGARQLRAPHRGGRAPDRAAARAGAGRAAAHHVAGIAEVCRRAGLSPRFACAAGDGGPRGSITARSRGAVRGTRARGRPALPPRPGQRRGGDRHLPPPRRHPAGD